MYLFGFSINILTLLAIVLATGLVVDDAIVVMENIYTKVENGMEPKEAAHRGSKEIILPLFQQQSHLQPFFYPLSFWKD